MRLTKRRGEVLKRFLLKSDISAVAGASGVSWRYVKYILEGQRPARSARAQKVVALLIKRAKQNKELLTNV